MFDHRDFDGHERVVHAYDAAAGLRAIIAIHSTVLGPAFGGCRMWPYPDSATALRDVLQLSRAMSHKSAILDLPYGGGKAVIMGDARFDKSADMMRAMGRLVDRLGGAYIIADDVGTTLGDLRLMREVTPYTAATTPAAQADLPVTAHGVLSAICAAVRHVLDRDDLTGTRVAVQGLGNVGYPLCDLLARAGANVLVADIDGTRVDRAVAHLGASAVPVAAIHTASADVFAPCALGGIINERSASAIVARIVCGGANNQLASPAMADALAVHGITYVPDYLANAGGVIDFHQEHIDDSPAAVVAAVTRIGAITTEVLEEAFERGCTPLAVADARVAARLQRSQAR